MATEVEMRPLGDLCDFLSGFAFKSGDLKGTTGIPVVKIKNVNNKVVTLEDMQFFPEDKLNAKINRFLLDDGDVLIAMTGQGSVGRVGRLRMPENTRLLLNQRVGKFVAKEGIANLDYIYYVISSEKYENILFNAASGSGQPNLSPATIKSVLVPYVPFKDQVKIAQVLAELDNKITLNRQINQTLEQMGQTLFKSWFVDFDPVIDNALDAGNPIPDELQHRAEARKAVRQGQAAASKEREGFKPLPDEVRQLFPDAFEESELGWVPKGWVVIPLANKAKVASGKRPPSKGTEKTDKEPIPVWGGNGIKWFTNAALSNDKHIITGRVGTLGTVYKVYGPSWASDNALVIRPLNNHDYEHVYQSLLAFDIQSLNSGSTQPLVTQTALNGILLVTPQCNQLLKIFQNIADGHDQKAQAIERECEALTQLRDTLLPKLISGELRLDDVEAAVEQETVST